MKKASTFVDTALEEVSWLKCVDPLADSLKAQVHAFDVDLTFLKMFLCCLVTWDPDTDVNINLASMLSSIQGGWDKTGEGLYAAGLLANHKRKFKDWNTSASKLEEKIQLCKQNIKKYCVTLISCSLQCVPLPSDQVLEFIDSILENLRHLNLSAEHQPETLHEKLLLLRHLVSFAAERCVNGEDLEDFVIHVHTWANKAACLTFLYFVNESGDEGNGNKVILLLTGLLQKVSLRTPEFIGMCFAVMKSTKLSRSDRLLFGEFVSSFLDFLLPNVVISLKEDFEILREGLIFFISFRADPPAEDSKLIFIRIQIDDVLHKAAYLICLFDGTHEDFARDKAILLDFGRTVRKVREQIEKLYARIPYSSWSMFPKTNGLGFVGHLLRGVEHMVKMMNGNPKLAPFVKHQIFTVKEELQSLWQSLQDIWELQKEHKEIKDLWVEIINVAYQAEVAINSSFFIDHPIWYNLTCLSSVLGKVKNVGNKVMAVKDDPIYRSEVLSSKLGSIDVPSIPIRTSGADEIVVGFEDEAQVLINRITRGTAQLDIVPIVGMGGLGKTTLAMKLFNESSVRYHFIVRSFCSVSQEHNSKRILLDILNNLNVVDDGIRAMMEDDLAHLLYKCLKGRRYLIIMDDIWDVKAWNDVQASFPDDKNGSRVLFTTRISNVALQAKSDCSPHYLRFLSTDESWELLRAKIFHNDPCPPHLCEVGKLIAEKCKGLPLAVVVIGGVLARIERSLLSWNVIADDLNSYVSPEGCMDVLELSYKHLPEALKSCWLYFGAFVEDKIIRAKRLMLLWAAEGFMPECEGSSFLNMAKQYLKDLVDRSLVLVASRSSTGGIRSCRVHDLIRNFCVTKAQQEQFFHLMTRFIGSNQLPMPILFSPYRLCIHDKKGSSVDAEARGPTVHTLLYFPISDIRVYFGGAFPYSSFKLLQVLDLQEVEVVDNYFQEEVTMLVHLRYLALKHDLLTRVPPTIVRLWNLETFILRNQSNCTISMPGTIWMMKRLRHVDIRSNALVALGNDVGKVASQLPDVESFSSVIIVQGEHGDELLRRLSHVRKLSCHCRTAWDPHQKGNRLPKFDRLTRLESLNMVGAGVWNPCKFSFPATLKKLSISNFCLPWSEFSAIAKLPCLEVLKLMSNAFQGRIWDVQDEEFPNLKFLKLHDLDIVEWIASDYSFPCLERLIVIDCRDLVEIPACFGEVPTLKAIEVYFCDATAESSAISIQKEQLEMGNEFLQVSVTERTVLYDDVTGKPVGLQHGIPKRSI